MLFLIKTMLKNSSLLLKWPILAVLALGEISIFQISSKKSFITSTTRPNHIKHFQDIIRLIIELSKLAEIFEQPIRLIRLGANQINNFCALIYAILIILEQNDTFNYESVNKLDRFRSTKFMHSVYNGLN